MDVVLFLAPFSLALGLVAVAAFWWTLRDGQYEDPAGDAARILVVDPDDRPKMEAPNPPEEDHLLKPAKRRTRS